MWLSLKNGTIPKKERKIEGKNYQGVPSIHWVRREGKKLLWGKKQGMVDRKTNQLLRIKKK